MWGQRGGKVEVIRGQCGGNEGKVDISEGGSVGGQGGSMKGGSVGAMRGQGGSMKGAVWGQ